jgi:hypothetical protein
LWGWRSWRDWIAADQELPRVMIKGKVQFGPSAPIPPRPPLNPTDAR